MYVHRRQDTAITLREAGRHALAIAFLEFSSIRKTWCPTKEVKKRRASRQESKHEVASSRLPSSRRLFRNNHDYQLPEGKTQFGLFRHGLEKAQRCSETYVTYHRIYFRILHQQKEEHVCTRDKYCHLKRRSFLAAQEDVACLHLSALTICTILRGSFPPGSATAFDSFCSWTELHLRGTLDCPR